jgi:hypothetical protein
VAWSEEPRSFAESSPKAQPESRDKAAKAKR